MSTNLETARRYIEASFTHDDLETCAQLIAHGYSFTDHTKSSVAETTRRCSKQSRTTSTHGPTRSSLLIA